MGTLTIQADTKKLDAQIAAEMAKLRTLQRQMSSLQVDADTKAALAKIAALERQYEHLDAGLSKLTANVDTNAALTKMFAIEAELKVLKSNARTVELAAQSGDIQAQIALVQSRLDALRAEARDIPLKFDAQGLVAAEATMLALEGATEGLAASAKKATANTGALTGIITGGGWNIAILGIGLWHIALDGLIEGIIAVTGAVIAFAAGAAAMSESAMNIATHLKAVDVTAAALGVNVPPLTGKFDALMKAMAPRTIEAFGGAMNIIQSQAGGVLSRMEPVVNLFDTWIAKIDLWVANQKDFGRAISSGQAFLSQFGTIIGEVVSAIDNLLTKDPGIAHFLLDFLEGVAGLLNIFSKLPAPIVEATLALHGFYIWFKVLAAAPILGVAKSLGLLSDAQVAAVGSSLKFQNVLKFLATNPLGWAVVAAGAIAYLGYQLAQASPEAKAFIANLEQGLSSLSSGGAIVQISSDIGSLRDQIAQVPAAAGKIVGSVADASTSADHFFGQVLHDAPLSNKMFSDLAHGVSSVFKAFTGSQEVGPAMIQARSTVAAYTGEIVKLSDEQTRLFNTTGKLTSGQNDLKLGALSVTQAWALMDLAGVKASDAADVQWQKIENLVTGYSNLSIQGGILKNSVDAVTFASLQQQEKVAQLNSSWDTFFKTVTGGESGFLSFAQQTIGLYAAMASSGVKLNESNGKVSSSMSGLAAAASTGMVSMTGLNDVSINARMTFLQSADAANQQVDGLTLLANAAGLGAKGTDLLQTAVQDMVASLLPAAKGSQALTDILYALAQRGGYGGADSFKALSGWVSKVQDPMKQLDGITTTLTTDASNLADDVKNLSIALGTDLNNAMAEAVLQANGGQQVFNDFANAVTQTTFNSQKQQTTALSLADTLLHLTGNASDAKNEFLSFAQGALKLTKDQADLLWSEISGKLGPAVNTMANATVPGVKKAFEDWADNGLHYGQGKADDLLSFLNGKLGPYLNNGLAQSVLSSKDKFEQWAGAGGASGLGLTKKQASELYDELQTLQQQINGMHGKQFGIEVDANGYVNVNGYKISAGAYFSPHAAGGFISGGKPGTDSVPAMLMPGEVVVPTNMVKAGAVDHLRGQLPGFAAGGQVPGFAAGGQVPGYAAGGTVGTHGNLGFAFPAGATDAISGFLNYETAQIAVNATKAFAGYVTQQKAIQDAAKAAAAATKAGVVNYSPGAGVAQWKSVVDEALKEAGAPVILDTNVLYQMQTESGGNPAAVNLWDSNAAAGHPCLTLDCVILTKRGWLTWENVQAGDETIGYNPQNGRSEWTAVTSVHYYEDAEVWRIGNKHWHADVTPNHRWWSDTRAVLSPEDLTECPECGWSGRADRKGLLPATPRSISTHRGRMHGVKAEPVMSTRGEFVLTQDLGHGHRIRLAAPADTDGIPGLSLEDVRVIAWLQGDGHIERVLAKPEVCPECGWLPGDSRPSRPRGNQPANAVAVHRAKQHGLSKNITQGEPAGWDGSIYQSKPAQVIKLRALLTGIEHSEHVRQRPGNTLPAHEFKLRRAYITDLMKRSQVMETGPEAFVLALSPDQRAAWLDSMIDAEGNRQPVVLAENGQRHGGSGEFVRIAQVDGPLQDAIKLAVYLEGYRPTFSANSAERNGYQPAGNVGMARPHIAPSMFSPHQVLERQPVWCVTTELGTWTAEQNGLPFLTGNSVGLMQVIAGTYAAYGAPRMGYPAPVAYGVSEQPLANVYAAIKYAQAVYGPYLMSGTNGLGSGHGYALGGMIPGMAAGGVLGSYFPNTAALRAALAASQHSEFSNLFGLGHSYATGAGKYYTAGVRHDFGVLWQKHLAEQNAYNRLAGAGLTPAGLSTLSAAANAEASVALRKTLSRSGAGGHPGWDANLRTALSQIVMIASATRGASGTGALGSFLPVMSAETHSYGGDIIIDATGRTIALNGGPLGAARGGMIPSSVFDRGGVLRPGPNLAWNLTGRPEHLTRGGGGGGELHIHVHNQGVIGSQTELDNWLTTSVRRVVKGRGGGDVAKAFNSH